MPETLRDIQSRLLDDLYDHMLLHLEVGLQLSQDVFNGREAPAAAISNLKQTTRWLLRIMAVNKSPQEYIGGHLNMENTEQVPQVVWPEDKALLRDIFSRHYPQQEPDFYSYLLLADGELQLEDEAEVVRRLTYLNLSLVPLFMETGALLPKTYIPTAADEEFMRTYPQWRIMRLERLADNPPVINKITCKVNMPSEPGTCLCGNKASLFYAAQPFLLTCQHCNRYFFDRQEMQLAGLPNDHIGV